MIKIFTDGSVYPNPNLIQNSKGAWAFIALNGDVVTAKWGIMPCVTNNRAEMIAVIEAMKHLNVTDVADIYTDCRYVCDGINKWSIGWRRYGWKNHIKNKDLWIKMIAEANTKSGLMVRWIEGHDNNIHNQFVDKLVNFARIARSINSTKFPIGELDKKYSILSKRLKSKAMTLCQ
jgi:ribonuclease HI